ncbi:unannotated protein [freshwater metagenome]|uniref:Unannotated protein n=1 Tax=freshwater metagenome TaxID=449393 RepID=A0A6J6CTL2_9ZZZZ
MHDNACVARKIASSFIVDGTMVEQLVDCRAVAFKFDDACPAVVVCEFIAVLICGEANNRCLQSKGKILRDDGDVISFGRQILGHRKNPVIVAIACQGRGKCIEVLMVDLDAQCSACVVNRKSSGEVPVFDAPMFKLT